MVARANGSYECWWSCQAGRILRRPGPSDLGDEKVEAALQELGVEGTAVLELSDWRTSRDNVAVAKCTAAGRELSRSRQPRAVFGIRTDGIVLDSYPHLLLLIHEEVVPNDCRASLHLPGNARLLAPGTSCAGSVRLYTRHRAGSAVCAVDGRRQSGCSCWRIRVVGLAPRPQRPAAEKATDQGNYRRACPP